jgi:hypothetical protein
MTMLFRCAEFILLQRVENILACLGKCKLFVNSFLLFFDICRIFCQSKKRARPRGQAMNILEHYPGASLQVQT